MQIRDGSQHSLYYSTPPPPLFPQVYMHCIKTSTAEETSEYLLK